MFSMRNIRSNTLFPFLFQIWLRVGFTYQQEPFVTTYTHMPNYWNEIIDPVKNCPNFVCELSLLSSSQIDTIVDLENKQRTDYAKAKRITNLYRVFWDNQLAKFARRKVQMCLPSTFEDREEKYQIYDAQAASHIYPVSSPIRLFSAVIQVVSGDRSENFVATGANRIIFKTKAIDYYIALFYSNEQNFKLRGVTTLMGCGYIFQQTNDTFIDRLLCAYGMFYTDSAPYVATIGRQPCSNCTYFEEKYYSDPRKLAIDRLEKWGCDYTYSSLCTDLNKRPFLRNPPSGFDCDDPTAGLDLARLAKIELPPHRKVEEVPIPCWYITAPLGLITLIILGFCFFHTITAFMTYMKYRATQAK